MRFTMFIVLVCVVCSGCTRRGEEDRRQALREQMEKVTADLYHDRETNHSSISDRSQEKITTEVARIAEGGNEFALDLYQQLRSEKGNLFYSPSSISTALAMTYAGAAGQTQAEMAKTLRIQMPNVALHDAMFAWQQLWTIPDDTDGIRLNMANRLWGQERYHFLPTFVNITRDKYGAELARLDFAQSEASRQTINQWIEARTENKITDLIPAGVISEDTRLVLTNAVYFHGTWTDPFEKDDTKNEEFHVSATEAINVPMMHQWDAFRYSAVDDLHILELPYGDGSLSMVVLLPTEIGGLAELEAKLTWRNVERWMATVNHEYEVKVSLPKFKTSSQFEMSGVLQAMGMTSAFDPNAADFSGMTNDEALFISAVIHKAFVDVNEEGTEAAAATGVAAAGSESEVAQDPPVFRADHPFVFMIRDNRTGAMLFVGRITNPLK